MKCIAYPITADTKFPTQTKIWVRSSLGHQWFRFWSNGLHENAHPAINISNNVYNWVSGYDFWHPLYGGDFTVYDQPEIPVAPPSLTCERKLQQQATKHSLEINRMSVELNDAINAERQRALELYSVKNLLTKTREQCELNYVKARNVQKTLDEVIVERNQLRKENEQFQAALEKPVNRYVLEYGVRKTGKTAAVLASLQMELDSLNAENHGLKLRLAKIKAAITSDLDEERFTKEEWAARFEEECGFEAKNH